MAPANRYTPPKSVGNGRTFSRNLTGRNELRAGITQLSDQVAARLRRHGLKCQGISLSIRDPEFHDVSRQHRLPSPTYLGREIAGAAMALADGFWRMDRPVRAVTVTALYLIPEEEAGAQLDLLAGAQEEKRERLEKLAGAMDAIRAKFGTDAITPASARRGLGDGHAPPPGSRTYSEEN